MQEEITTIILEDDNYSELTLETLNAQVILLRNTVQTYVNEIRTLQKDLDDLKQQVRPVGTVWRRTSDGKTIQILNQSKENN